jgi:hypothetical protein
VALAPPTTIHGARVASVRWSVLNGKLSRGDLGHLRAAWPQFTWDPLCAVVQEYCGARSSVHPKSVSTRAILKAYLDQDLAVALGAVIVHDPYSRDC